VSAEFPVQKNDGCPRSSSPRSSLSAEFPLSAEFFSEERWVSAEFSAEFLSAEFFSAEFFSAEFLVSAELLSAKLFLREALSNKVGKIAEGDAAPWHG
jgi:hypothetical protein